METRTSFEKEYSVKNKMDEEKKQMMYKVFYNVCSAAAAIGIPYLFYVAAKHLF